MDPHRLLKRFDKIKQQTSSKVYVLNANDTKRVPELSNHSGGSIGGARGPTEPPPRPPFFKYPMKMK